MPALYRTYRPRRFSEVVGQPHIVRTLRNAVRLGTPAHAYLFCGSRGLGKTTLARVLARALNCPNTVEGEACLACDICAQVDAGTFLDLVEVDAASNTGVDNVRALIETVRYQPTMGTHKVYIIDEAHMLSKGAWNALLKTLEEPPANTVFILATTEHGKVPATINSRAQRFDFLKFRPTEIADQLTRVLQAEQRALAPAVVHAVVDAAGGGMRDALTLLDQVLALGDDATEEEAFAVLGVTDRALLHELVQLIRAGDRSALPPFFARVSERYFDSLAVNRDLLQLLREELETRLHTGSGSLTESELVYLIRQFMRSYKEIGQSPDPFLPLLIAAVEACDKCKAPSTSSSVRPAPTVESVVHAAPVAAEPQVVPTPVAVVDPVSVAAPLEPAAVSVDEEQVRAQWHEVCRKVKEVNGPLATLLKNSPITQVGGGAVVVGVKYLFHKEQIESTKSRAVIADAVQAVFGGPVRVVAEFVAPEEGPVAPVTAVLGDALKIFGGELVE